MKNSVNDYIDKTIINLCKYIENIIKDKSAENNCNAVAENTKALAMLVIAKAFDRSIF